MVRNGALDVTKQQSVLLLTPPEAAKALAISQRTLWGLTKAGQIRCVRINGWTVRYDPADLRNWMEKQKDQPTPQARKRKNTGSREPKIA
jgi:excisionase family DNA binding protein